MARRNNELSPQLLMWEKKLIPIYLFVFIKNLGCFVKTLLNVLDDPTLLQVPLGYEDKQVLTTNGCQFFFNHKHILI